MGIDIVHFFQANSTGEKGLPNRHGLNPAFISMAMGAGLTSAITNPLEASLMQVVRGADVLMNHDPQCTNWIAAYREPSPKGGPKSGRGGRRGGRRRRTAKP